jgi:hypothetical protein
MAQPLKPSRHPACLLPIAGRRLRPLHRPVQRLIRIQISPPRLLVWCIASRLRSPHRI